MNVSINLPSWKLFVRNLIRMLVGIPVALFWIALGPAMVISLDVLSPPEIVFGVALWWGIGYVMIDRARKWRQDWTPDEPFVEFKR